MRPPSELPGDSRGQPGDDFRGILMLAIGALAFSTSSLLVRLAFPISALEVTFWRLFFAALFVTGIAAIRGELRGWFQEILSYWAYGLAMSLHFLFFVAAPWFTSIAHALSIVYFSPAIIAIASTRIFAERRTRIQAAGIAISIAGIAVMSGFEPEMTGKKLLGDLFALLSGAMFAVYSILGRVRRRQVSVFAYTSRMYAWAALWALPLLLVSFEPANYTAGRFTALVLAGVVPIGIGHTLYNAALRYLSATRTNLMATQEVTGGILLGAIFLAELPGPVTIVGVLMNLAGIVIVLTRRASIRPREQPDIPSRTPPPPD